MKPVPPLTGIRFRLSRSGTGSLTIHRDKNTLSRRIHSLDLSRAYAARSHNPVAVKTRLARSEDAPDQRIELQAKGNAIDIADLPPRQHGRFGPRYFVRQH